MAKVRVDRNVCIGCGVCTSICPEGFKLVDGKSSVIDEKAACAKEAAKSCPVNAIIIEEE